MINIYDRLLCGLVCTLLLGLTSGTGYAASTFERVYDLLQANCTSSGCHGATNFEAISLVGTQNEVYNSLVGVAPKNEYALAKGYKLVDPNHPYNSFLLKKVGAGFDDYISLHEEEGDEMLNGDKLPLADYDIELIRQWIMYGASETGSGKVDYDLIKDYYTNGGVDFIRAPQPPDPSEGIQLRYGPIFLAANEEVELMKHEKVNNEDPIEVYRMDGIMTIESHHMLLFKTNSYEEGIRRVPLEDAPFNGGQLTSAWQDDCEFILPEGSAFFWDANTILDFDYHIANTNDEILPADFYLNIYYKPRTPDSETIEMKAELENRVDLLLFQGIQTQVRKHNFDKTRYIYLITSHTHKYGIDFDIFTNEDGEKGEQIYEGFYNGDYTYNQGYYDWEHPAIRTFWPTKKVEDGLIFETKWDIKEPLVTFGLTTEGEMMLFTYFYTTEELKYTAPTGIEEEQLSEVNDDFEVFPNPFEEVAMIKYTLDEGSDVKLEVYDVLGKKVSTLADEFQTTGNYNYSIENMHNSTGVYFVRLSANGKTFTRKLVGME